MEENVNDAIRCITERDVDLAQRVIRRDDDIDRMEIDVEEECLHTLALHQPVAFDLRYVVAVLKINNDLERIGDHAVNMAIQAQMLAEESEVERVPYDLRGMGERAARGCCGCRWMRWWRSTRRGRVRCGSWTMRSTRFTAGCTTR